MIEGHYYCFKLIDLNDKSIENYWVVSLIGNLLNRFNRYKPLSKPHTHTNREREQNNKQKLIK